MSKQSAALGLPIWGTSSPTSLHWFHDSIANRRPSLLIPGSPTADTYSSSVSAAECTNKPQERKITFTTKANGFFLCLAIDDNQESFNSHIMLNLFVPKVCYISIYGNWKGWWTWMEIWRLQLLITPFCFLFFFFLRIASYVIHTLSLHRTYSSFYMLTFELILGGVWLMCSIHVIY